MDFIKTERTQCLSSHQLCATCSDCPDLNYAHNWFLPLVMHMVHKMVCVWPLEPATMSCLNTCARKFLSAGEVILCQRATKLHYSLQMVLVRHS